MNIDELETKLKNAIKNKDYEKIYEINKLILDYYFNLHAIDTIMKYDENFKNNGESGIKKIPDKKYIDDKIQRLKKESEKRIERLNSYLSE